MPCQLQTLRVFIAITVRGTAKRGAGFSWCRMGYSQLLRDRAISIPFFPDCLSDSPIGIPALVLPRPGEEAGAGNVGPFALSALPACGAGAPAIYQARVSFLGLVGMYRLPSSLTSASETQQTHTRSGLASDCHFVLCSLHLQTSWALFYS